MKIIPIYDKDGVEINQLQIDDIFSLTNERVCKGEKGYYKGVGINYSSHYIPPDPKFNMYGYTLLNKSNVFYMGPRVSKFDFKGKSGIFLEPYQPQFSDFIGTCGSKELSIIENSEAFQRSSVIVRSIVNWDKDNNQYYFVLDYKCARRKYFDDGDPKSLYKLLEYMVQENWNFIWDKKSINDISYNGLVTDVADIFYSKELKSKIGTVYSVLYSLGKLYPDLYKAFCIQNHIFHVNDMDYVFNTIFLLEKFGIDMSDFFMQNARASEIYKNVVMNYLIVGRNCGDCCYVDLGNQVREGYIQQTKKQLNIGD